MEVETMSTKLENFSYGTKWTDFKIDYFEGYYSHMSHFHMHDYYEISLILSGNIKVLLSDKTQSGSQSRLVLNKPLSPHLMMYEPGQLYKRFNLLFSKEFLVGYVPEWKELLSIFGNSGTILVLEDTQVSDFLRLIDDIEQDENLFHRKLYLMLFLSKTSQLLDSAKSTTDSLPSHIMGAISFLQTNYAKKITAEELAWELGISRTKLMTTFKKHTGITFNNYLTQYRLKEAIRCLWEGDTVQTVAEKCGFGDPSNFIRAFHARYNTTPMQYIKSEQKKSQP